MAGFGIGRRELIGTLVVLVVAAGCARLGVWQLDRLEQRRERNARIESRLAAAPLDLREALTDTVGLEYTRVRVAGEYDNARTLVLAGTAHRGQPGVRILTPLRPDGGGPAVLVDRGFVPAPDAATVELDPLVVYGPVALTGLVRFLEPARGAGPAGTRVDTVAVGAAGARAYWQRLDAAAVRERVPYPVAPFYLQALPAEGAPDLPVRVGPPELGEGSHLGYAVQWFSFGLIALVGWVALMLRPRAGPQPSTPRQRPGSAV